MNRRVRVLHVISSLSTYGAERLVANLVGALARDIDVGVLTMYTAKEEAAAGFAGALMDTARRRDRRDTTFFARMVGAIRRWQPDIVHTHVHNGKYWGRLAAIAANVPVIVHTEHNSDFHIHPAVQLVNRALHARTAKIIAFSRGHASRIARAEHVNDAKIEVIANGIEPHAAGLTTAAAKARVADDDRSVILHVGRFEPVKNQRLAVEAFAASPNLRRRAKLYFAGAGAGAPDIRAHAAVLGIVDDVSFLGYRDDVDLLLKAADALLITSLNEAMPLTAIEAMIAGVPIVTVPWDGSAELFEGGTLAAIASGYAPLAVAGSLEAVLDDAIRSALVAEAARSVALKRYTLDACAARHADLYRSLLAC